MARKGLAVLVVIIALAVAAAPLWARGFENKKAAGKYEVMLKAESYPLIKGNNTIIVTVSDKAGKAVTDVKVRVRHYMTAMSGMAPMSYTTDAVQKGQAYSLTADVPMEGGWKFEVSVGDDASTTFNLDAR